MTIATNNSSTPGGLELKLDDALSGVQQQLVAGSTLQINGAAMTQAQLVTQLSGYLAPFTAAANEKTAYAQAIKARKAVEPPAREFLIQLKAALVALLGRGNPLLEKFGMLAKLPSKPSVQTALLAAAKRKLTRAKRGTLGKKQKAAIVLLGTPSVSVGAEGATVQPSVGEQAQAAAAAAAKAPVAPVSAPVAGAGAGVGSAPVAAAPAAPPKA